MDKSICGFGLESLLCEIGLQAMEKSERVVAIIEFVGTIGLVAWVPALPGIPYVVGPSLAEVRRRLEGQLQTHFLTNFPGLYSYWLDLILIIPSGSRVNPS